MHVQLGDSYRWFDDKQVNLVITERVLHSYDPVPG